MSTTATATGKFVWHEQVSDDPAKAKAFYTELFGWDTQVFDAPGMDYDMINANGGNHGGFAKAMEGAPPPHWLGHVQVDDVDATVEKATAAGGSLAAGPFEMGEVGKMAIVKDPQGAFVSVYTPEGEGEVAEGVFVWDELGTTDVDAAQEFYGDVFGWTAKDMGSDFGGYRIFHRDESENGIAGFMQLQDPSWPATWIPYVGVEDVDATVAKAKELGGSTVVEGMDVPTVGRIAVIKDPQGAVLGIIKPAPRS
jgi:predicted enzyme related to lactoylglutathione lyase